MLGIMREADNKCAKTKYRATYSKMDTIGREACRRLEVENPRSRVNSGARDWKGDPTIAPRELVRA